jgi:hypothetical protein
MEKLKYKNFTPHTVRVYDPDGEVLLQEYPSDGSVRLTEVIENTEILDGIPVVGVPIVMEQKMSIFWTRLIYQPSPA